MALSMALQTAIMGLRTSQKAVDTTANNISNVNTAGYTKKTHLQESVVVAGYAQGVKDLRSIRTVDESLIRDILRESGIEANLNVLASYTARVQDLFGSPSSDSSISHAISDLQASLETLAIDAEKYTSQADFVNKLQDVIQKMNKISDFMQNLRLEADREMNDRVTEINTILTSIDKLNADIMKTDVIGMHSSDDLKDQRDLQMQRLSELMDVQYFTRSTGEVVIMTGNGTTLLDADPYYLSNTGSVSMAPWVTFDGNNIAGIYVDGKDITGEIRNGELAGFINVRDNLIPDLQAQLDELTLQMTTSMNQIHNQGISYSNMSSELQGNKIFLDPSQQIIDISSGEVRIVIFDKQGNQAASTALVSELGFSSGNLFNSVTHPVNDSLCAVIENWLTTSPDGPKLFQAKVGFNENGQMYIDLGTSEYSIAFRDEASPVLGSDQQDVTIRFDADADGSYDQTYSGFSSLFGFNDLLVTRTNEWLHDSKILSANYRADVTSLTTITFSDKNNGLQFGSIDITPGMSMKDIAEAINNDPNLKDIVRATYIKEGEGYRLRIAHIDGNHMEITESTNNGFLEKIGLAPSACGLANSVQVSQNISRAPDKISRGVVQFDQNSGRYFVSAADSSNISKMAQMFSGNQSFARAGSMSAGLYSFTNYSSSIVSQVAMGYNNTSIALSYQSDLVSSLKMKSSEVSGVNLDEELAQLIIYERSYSASAKVITTVNEMMITLENMI